MKTASRYLLTVIIILFTLCSCATTVGLTTGTVIDKKHTPETTEKYTLNGAPQFVVNPASWGITLAGMSADGTKKTKVIYIEEAGRCGTFIFRE